MPQVTIRTTINDREETLSEYLCDWTDCPNVAVELLWGRARIGAAGDRLRRARRAPRKARK